jgi:LCP family protein required for cell wall assembly
MQTRHKITITLIALLLAACNFPIAPAAVSMNQNLLFNPANPTTTPTPFQPLPPTPVYFPTATPIPAMPEPTDPASAGIGQFTSSSSFTPPGLLPQPKGQVNVLLLGSDQRFGSYGFRTDTIILATINPAEDTVHLTSFPRDLYVDIPGGSNNRINTAWGRGGFETLSATFERNFGIRPDFYVLINFWSFNDVVNSLGGIDVYASQPLSEYTSRGWFTIPAGLNHMDGPTALYYSRSRKSTSDFDRNRRQQEVIKAIFTKLMSLYSISKIPELYDIYVDNVTTNLKIKDVIPFIPVAARMRDADQIKHYYIGRKQVTSWTTPTGAAVLLPNHDAIMEIIREALNSPE